MAGQFYLGEAIKFSFVAPTQFETNVAGGAVTLAYENDSTKIYFAVMDPSGAFAFGSTLYDAVHGAVSHVSAVFSGTMYTVAVSPLFPVVAGRWTISAGAIMPSLASPSTPQFDYCDVLPYYNPAQLTQKFDPAATGGAAILHYDDPQDPPLQYQRVYNVAGDPATAYGDITTVGPITVGAP